ncbi:Sialate O-acetylesterase [Planctomycetales bacterium 10988]|nr:Sialate O-acetylesterase [Planctomycetales bacterium 10988]
MTAPYFTSLRSGWLVAMVGLALGTSAVQAEVSLPSIFTDHMVLQREHENKIWGSASAGEEITLTINEQSVSTTADDDGKWEAKLPPMPAGGPHEIQISGENELTLKDVLVGEVWVCSGQSNMAWPVDRAINSDLEIQTAKYPQIRLISIPNVGTQEAQDDFKGEWQVCSPETVGQFSAVGYFFGRDLHQMLDVPIGLIDNAWGGSASEAWVDRETLEKSGKFDNLLKKWDNLAKTYDPEKVQAAYQKQLENWQAKVRELREAGKDKFPNRPRAPRDALKGQHRPANLYNGVLNPIIGYGIRGAIWYQGESNSGRAYQYRDLFPLMIQTWRKAWDQGDFPFYWVQLADFRDEVSTPGDSDWAELREAQTMTLSLPNSGQAVTIDLGEGRDIHPTKKQEVARRLARWALAETYGFDIAYRSATYKSMERDGQGIIITLDNVNGALETHDTAEVKGFAIAGEDHVFHNAQAKIISDNQVKVWSDEVQNPVAVRYAWANNPVMNLQDSVELPVTPFRTDDWEGVTAGVDQ